MFDSEPSKAFQVGTSKRQGIIQCIGQTVKLSCVNFGDLRKKWQGKRLDMSIILLVSNNHA
jgi:hypothetical protein